MTIHFTKSLGWGGGLLLLIWLALPGQLRAQAHQTYQPHEVQRLAPAAEPPGGLVPYRHAKLWGYADTSGYVVLKPWLVAETQFFVGGFARHYDPAFREGEFMVFNAHGEYLHVRPGQAVVLAAGGGLAVVAATRSWSRPFVTAFPQQFWRGEEERDRWCPTTAYYGFVYAGLEVNLVPLGYNLFRLGCYVPRPRPDGRPDSVIRYTLADGQGHRLTNHYYDELDYFREGRALVVRDGRLGYLNARGQEVIALRYQAPPYTVGTGSCTFRHGVARVYEHGLRTTLIDTTGRVLVPARAGLQLGSPDEAGFTLAQLRDPAGDTVMQFLAPTGRPAFRQVFTRAEPFWHDRAWVWQGSKVGLINRRGQLLVQCQYDALYFANMQHGVATKDPAKSYAPARCFFEQPYEQPVYHIDTTYLQCERNGKFGFVDFLTGRELVPPRYDGVICSFRQGFACVQRQGQAYIIDRNGQEISKGQFYDAFNNGGMRRDWQWGQGEQLHFLLSVNGPASWWLVPDTAWYVADRRGGVVAPPQPLSRLPLFVTGAGLTAVQAPSGCGLLGAGGQWAVPPRYGRIEQYGNLLVAFAAASNADSTTSAALLDPQGRLLRELPRTYSSYFENKLRWLYLTQKTPAGQMTTSLLDQAGRTLLTLDGYYSIIRIATNAHSSQRHYLVQVSAERTPNGEADLPHGRPGGYMSISGRKFWQD